MLVKKFIAINYGGVEDETLVLVEVVVEVTVEVNEVVEVTVVRSEELDEVHVAEPPGGGLLVHKTLK